MSEELHETPAPEQHEGTVWDAPNQQTVREDQSAPWDEGTGGVPGQGTVTVTETGAVVEQKSGDELESMTKAELLEHARELGVSPANNDMSKDELREAIDKKSRKA